MRDQYGGAIRIVSVALISVLLLSACDGAREAMGLDKQSPDEFAVVTRAPLSMPPDFGLRPPQPGAQRPQEAEVKDAARDLLTRSAESKIRTSRLDSVTQGEMALLRKAGATNPDPNIRRELDRESSIIAASDDSFVDSLLFWQEKQPPGAVVDADKESRRLRENAALGDAPTKGRSPTIVRKPKGWLEGIIN